MHRHYGLPRKQQIMRPDLAQQQFWASVKAGAQIIIALLALLAIYGWMGARDTTALVENKLNRTELLLTSYMTHGAVEDADTIYTCAHPAYELPKSL